MPHNSKMNESFEGDPGSVPAAVRRSRMRQFIASRGYAKVSDLSRELGVSEVTIRADLSVLERDDVIVRTHGGAMLADSPSALESALERSFEAALAASSDEKRRIGLGAVDLIESGSSVILDVGTTTTAIADALLARDDLEDVVLITSSISVALVLEPLIPRFTVIVTGGSLRPLQHSLVAPYAADVLATLHADLAFIGCTGVDAVGGVTNVNLPETEIKRAMRQAAERAVVVADSTKLGRTQLGRIGGPADFSLLLTGVEGDAGVVGELAAAGLPTRQL